MREKLEKNKYLYQGIILFGALGATVVLYFLLQKFSIVLNFIVKILTILIPVFIGILFAYLLNPVVKFFERKLSIPLAKKVFKDDKIHSKFNRVFAIFVTYFILSILLILFIIFVIPNFLESIQIMVTNVPIYVNNIYGRLQGFMASNPDLAKIVDSILSNITDYANNSMIPSVDTIMSSLASGITGFITTIGNIAIGVVVSVYLIYDKEMFMRGTKKFLTVVLPKRAYSATMSLMNYTDKIFGGFMTAKIIDSTVIGLLTFVILTLFGIPYALVISILVGVTNIIPYFGPIIGAVPSALLLFMIDPNKAITFVILIFLIQQFDGNILGPKLIGNKTGVKSFWVLFSILLFGGLFGFVGMIFGVPIFAIIYTAIKSWIDKRLELKSAE